MAKRALLVLIVIFSSFQHLCAQDFSNLWQGHFSYFDIKDVTQGGDKIYAASENAIFSYDINTNEISTITTVEGLSGELISTIEYSFDFQILIIGYENGLMELYFETDQDVLSVVDILDKPTISPDNKRINDFYEDNGLVYISTNFGISIYDLDRLEFGDTYFIGSGGTQIRVNKTSIFNGAIYAACGNNNAIKKGELSNPNLIDYQQWTTIGIGNYTSVEAIEDRFYALSDNNTLFELINDNLQQVLVFPDAPNDSEVSSNELHYTTNTNVFIYDSNATLIAQIDQTEDFETNFSSSVIINGQIYIGTSSFGVLTTQINTLDYLEIRPEGPLRNSAFKIRAGNNELWVSFGEYTTFYDPNPLQSRGLSHYIAGDERWVNIPSDSLLGARDLNYISLNPFNPNQVFVSSFQDGLLEINDDIPTVLYNQDNSGLESLIFPPVPSFVSIRVSGSEFDRTGKLWTVTSKVDGALKSYDPASGQWQSFSFGDLIPDALNDEAGFSDLVIDGNGTKWVGSLLFGVIGYNENSGGSTNINNINTEEQNLPFTSVRALDVDSRNRLWIGTDFGLRVLFNTSNFFDDPNPTVNEIIILENSIPRELLEDQFITDIKSDGSDNKWVGTLSSGIFYFSPDGQNTIYHFTTDNSPIPSNTINDISIDQSDGTVYIATARGIVAFSAGGSQPKETLDSAFVYPNPVRPEYNLLGSNDLNDITKGIKISGLTENVNVKITDIEGNLVAEAQSNVNLRSSAANYNFAIDGGTGVWNGKNLGNNIVATGVYLVLISDLDSFETKVLKLLIVR
ncbi:MAG: two-component regulator propeller domain-containing protein [Bacteroidota bacterium]